MTFIILAGTTEEIKSRIEKKGSEIAQEIREQVLHNIVSDPYRSITIRSDQSHEAE